MPIQIEDGSSRETLSIGTDRRLKTRAITQSEQDAAGVDGDSYNVNTGDMTLTTTGESAVLYIKNDETRDLIIDSIVIILGSHATTDGDCGVVIERNPTGGTIVDNATAVSINTNRNFGSSNTLSVTAYKGTEGYTLTGADGDYISTIVKTPVRSALEISTLVPQGKSIGVLLTPGGSGNVICQVAAVCHLKPST